MRQPTIKYPGVYIQEVPAFANGISQVPTAVPAFIGYTEKAEKNGKSITNIPTRISSLQEYISFFGEDFKSLFTLSRKRTTDPQHKISTLSIDGLDYELAYKNANEALLYRSIQFFYANGGGSCYVISVGTYGADSQITIDKHMLLGVNANEGLQSLQNEQEPTIIVVPDAVLLPVSDCYEVYRDMLAHCGFMKNRVAIFDVHNGFRKPTLPEDPEEITLFRTQIGNENLSYGTAYYPWLQTSLSNASFTFKNIDPSIDLTTFFADSETAAKALWVEYLSTGEEYDLHAKLLALSPTYTSLLEAMNTLHSLMPPAAAMAGIYTQVDTSRGVWKAPANVSLNTVIKPLVNITNGQQETLTMDVVSGKSINAIRFFPGVGTLVWGARTLDGNSSDWRYINVRRTVMMIEQSIQASIKSYVFEPNDATTWSAIKSSIENFLMKIFREGALAGSKAEEAYDVNVGLGTTMTAQDILEGVLRIQILLAIVRPAEFIVITLEQQMQKS